MLPDRVSNPGPPTYESGALPIALRGPAGNKQITDESEMSCSMSKTKYIFIWCKKAIQHKTVSLKPC